MPHQDLASPEPSKEDVHAHHVTQPKRRAWFVFGVLIALAVGLAALNFFQSHTATFISGEGTVRGTILGEEGKPVNAAISVEFSKLKTATDQNGFFEIRGIPMGSQTIVITWMFAGHEVPVEIHRGGITDLGTIYVPTHPRPEHNSPRLEWR
ncbi:MAG: hypothetical protein IT308_10015 [Anaerolineaceae bacterium]|nr:hypothetical protein [Anaerolineaceae bacterium]